jgi:hypothetical protein
MGLLVDIGQCADCSRTSVGFTPLNDLGQRMYRGYQGGLYPGGSNTRPANHEAIGLDLAYNITPLDRNGNPDPDNGKIVLLSIGMSNTTQEFSMFKRIADQDKEKNPQLVIVDGAQGGMSADRILNPNDGGTGTRFWTTVNQRLMQQGVTPNQVQVAWIKQADPGPMQPFPVEAQRLQAELIIIVQILKNRFPNIALAYLSSRIYAGYATTPLNPEPFAYESGFSVKWLIESQINGDETLSLDVAPWLSWGPYLWADGLVPRSDGWTWECADLQPSDGTHPSPSGQLKVAFLLLDFFKNDSTTVPWYLKG